MRHPKSIYYYGSEKPLPENRLLKAGPLSVIYEAGNLRYVKVGRYEVLRMINSAVRDHNWGTVPGILKGEKLRQDEQNFEISYQCLFKEGAIEFLGDYTITGSEDGKIIFEMKGEALSTFQKNRIGFCILHPLKECIGKTCEVTHVDGSITQSIFPEAISPHQPFKNMRTIKWFPADGCTAELVMEGDTFEMEDHRNWTDASFKTYSTPLEIPFPVEIKRGERIHQKLSLSVRGDFEHMAPEDQGLTFSLDESVIINMPKMGIGKSSLDRGLSLTEIEPLKKIPFSHYRADLRLYERGWITYLEEAVQESEQLHVNLELALHFGNDVEDALQEFILHSEKFRDRIASITVFHRDTKSTRKELLDQVLPALRHRFHGVKIGAGTDAFFTELNRERTPAEGLDFLQYSINPQVHAFDNQSLVETLEAQSYTVESARQFAQGLPVHISPVTFKPRFNPNATGPEPAPAPGELPPQVDERQMSLFGAGWTLGSIKYLAEAGAASLTYYETVGMRGIIQGDMAPPLPDQFRAEAGMVFPVYHIFREILEHQASGMIIGKSSHPLIFNGLVFSNGQGKRIILANHTGRMQEIRLGPVDGKAMIKTLDEDNMEKVMYHPDEFINQSFQAVNIINKYTSVRLKPYAIAIMHIIPIPLDLIP